MVPHSSAFRKHLSLTLVIVNCLLWVTFVRLLHASWTQDVYRITALPQEHRAPSTQTQLECSETQSQGPFQFRNGILSIQPTVYNYLFSGLPFSGLPTWPHASQGCPQGEPWNLGIAVGTQDSSVHLGLPFIRKISIPHYLSTRLDHNFITVDLLACSKPPPGWQSNSDFVRYPFLFKQREPMRMLNNSKIL